MFLASDVLWLGDGNTVDDATQPIGQICMKLSESCRSIQFFNLVRTIHSPAIYLDRTNGQLGKNPLFFTVSAIPLPSAKSLPKIARLLSTPPLFLENAT
ncbi:hypothetical protein H2136_14745 [Aeromonas hydrophila]|uniref:Uncharacterized protein n=1 Tax=Aeromonas hydrophila TaxID=644 RepID=A0A926IYN2_AERHY|nr:hypothetical protein [Aeromonas hydrophila]